MTFRERVLNRLKELGLRKTDLAERSGQSYSYICKLLMENRGNRENPSPAVKQNIADALGLLPGDLDDSLGLGEFLIDELYKLSEPELAALREVEPSERFATVLSLMQRDPRWRNLTAVADALGLPVVTLETILSGVDPDTAVIRELESRTKLTTRFWLRGRLDPHPRLIKAVESHEDARGYLEAVDIAIKADIPSETVKGVVSAIANRGAK